MLDAMGSEAFEVVKTYLGGRQEAISQIAGGSSTDPQEIGRAMQAPPTPATAPAPSMPAMPTLSTEADSESAADAQTSSLRLK